MVILILYAKLIQQLNNNNDEEDNDMLKMTMNDFVSRLCLLLNVYLNASVSGFLSFFVLKSGFLISYISALPR